MFRRPEFSHKSAPPKHPTVREKWKCREGCEAKPFLRPPGKSVGNVRKFPDVVFRDGFLPFFSIRRLDKPGWKCYIIQKSDIYINFKREQTVLENMTATPKHQQVCDCVVSILTRGAYKVGDRLPSERDLAAELNVNVLTVRRAFRDLIAADFITKRVGSGTYLNRPLSNDWNQHAVNLLIDSRCHSAVQHLFEQYGKKTAEKNQREYRIVHTNSGTDVKSLIHSYILYHQPTIFCGTLPNYRGFSEDLQKAPELFVAAAVHEDHSIPAVIAADAVGVDMLMDYLTSQGHRRIAFLSPKSKDMNIPDSVAWLQRNAWRSKIGTDYKDSLVINADLSISGNHVEVAYKTIKALEHIDFTAMICLTDEFMFGAMAALREKGKSIPEDISIVSIGNTVLSRYCYPPVTSCDLDLETHMDEAFRLLFHNLTHPGDIEMLRLVKPFLVTRQSVRKIN